MFWTDPTPYDYEILQILLWGFGYGILIGITWDLIELGLRWLKKL